MKKSKNSGKLALKKETIAQLNKSQYSAIVGGYPTTSLCPEESWGLTTRVNCNQSGKIGLTTTLSV